MIDNKKDKFGENGRLPDIVFETYDGNKYQIPYRTTNALVFPLKLIPDEEVLSGEDLSSPVETGDNTE